MEGPFRYFSLVGRTRRIFTWGHEGVKSTNLGELKIKKN